MSDRSPLSTTGWSPKRWCHTRNDCSMCDRSPLSTTGWSPMRWCHTRNDCSVSDRSPLSTTGWSLLWDGVIHGWGFHIHLCYPKNTAQGTLITHDLSRYLISPLLYPSCHHQPLQARNTFSHIGMPLGTATYSNSTFFGKMSISSRKIYIYIINI